MYSALSGPVDVIHALYKNKPSSFRPNIYNAAVSKPYGQYDWWDGQAYDR